MPVVVVGLFNDDDGNEVVVRTFTKFAHVIGGFKVNGLGNGNANGRVR